MSLTVKVVQGALEFPQGLASRPVSRQGIVNQIVGQGCACREDILPNPGGPPWRTNLHLSVRSMSREEPL